MEEAGIVAYPAEAAEADAPRQISRKLFLASFDHSQGADAAQTLIAQYLHLTFPTLFLTTEGVKELVTMSHQAANQIISSSQRHKYLTDARPQLEMEAKNFWNVFNLGEQPPREQIIRQLTIALICRDWLYKDGRPRAAEEAPVPYDPRKDSYLSFLCYYALQGHTTGIPEYNQMYQDVALFLRASPGECLGGRELWRPLRGTPTDGTIHAPYTNAGKLEQIIAAYNLHHPAQEPVTPPWAARA
jgi:hypothetical protein